MEPNGVMGFKSANLTRQAIQTNFRHATLSTGRHRTPTAIAQQPEENSIEYSKNFPGSDQPSIIFFINLHQ